MKKFTTQMVVFGLVCLMTAISPALADRGKDAASQPAGTPVPPPPIEVNRVRRVQREPTVVKTYALKHADSRKIADTVQQSGIDCRCVPLDGQVLINASMSTHAEIEKLLSQLDTPVIPTPPRDIQVIKTPYLGAAKVADILRKIAPTTKFTVDESADAILLDTDSYDSLRNVLERLFSHPELFETKVEQKNYIIRVVWLISDPEGKLSLSPIPEDLLDVAEEMSHMGIDGLHVTAQSMAQTKSIGKFTLLSTPSAFDNCVMTVEGDIDQAPGGSPQLKMSVGATGTDRSNDKPGSPPRPGPNSGLLASFNTNLTAPLGQKIVLGVATTLGYQSVFVIQLLEKKAPDKTPTKVPNQAKPAPAKAK